MKKFVLVLLCITMLTSCFITANADDGGVVLYDIYGDYISGDKNLLDKYADEIEDRELFPGIPCKLYYEDGKSKWVSEPEIDILYPDWYMKDAVLLYNEELDVFANIHEDYADDWIDNSWTKDFDEDDYYDYTRLYSIDGESKWIKADKVYSRIESGEWFKSPVVLLFSDEEQKYFHVTDVEEMLDDGWTLSPDDDEYDDYYDEEYDDDDYTVKVYDKENHSKWLPRAEAEALFASGEGFTTKVKKLWNAENTIKYVELYNVEKYLEEGWYTEPVVMLYSENGDSMLFGTSQVEAQLKVGWYKEPVQRLYAEGKSAVFSKSQVKAQLNVGWYTEPVTRMYTLDGRNSLFYTSQVEAYKKVGWYNGEPVKMYNINNESKYFDANDVANAKKNGWYPYKVQKLYAEGKSNVFPLAQVEAQIKVGWYTEPVQRLYAEGKSKLYVRSKVSEKLKQGWYTEPVTRMYTLDGRNSIFYTSQVEAYKKVGWYDGEPVLMYGENSSKYFGSNDVEKAKENGWYSEPVQRLYKENTSRLFPQSEVNSQLNNGWFSEPVKRYYKTNGSSQLFRESEYTAADFNRDNVWSTVRPTRPCSVCNGRIMLPCHSCGGSGFIGWRTCKVCVYGSYQCLACGGTGEE